ncbi:hypothetical protein VOLCADRAFT_100489 [Volvox carteri f. nagariensis]|uniref:Guanylate cyclase domain-containing protein n=1 Tax=Volvox carteri f. nagariensis TaxID=3068 RepID=D8UKB3_VOLCA|nr:uncharacterized protein VOLCADRAFT_100489 [Volvox carteri f. nagariensis]EFJ39833.1 hypothetical protein VOLCADRAFT_100489 [Volvox carteri f. nagariensis]|eukprot:XP_002959105.1 hypothetical protein VOLCADRAFT_100489 [Volvox carteri f. nagariensis]
MSFVSCIVYCSNVRSQVTTEGDAFLVAFHDPVDAVRWALLLQSALLKLDWPPLLLEHPLCRPRPLVPVAAAPPTAAPAGGAGGAAASSSAPLLVLFKGLSVRMGIATGVPSSVREHPVTRRMQYTGAVLRLATGIAELGSGGQILVEPMTFKGIHNKIEELDVVEAEAIRIIIATLVLPAPTNPPCSIKFDGYFTMLDGYFDYVWRVAVFPLFRTSLCADKANSKTSHVSGTHLAATTLATEDDPFTNWTDSSRQLLSGGGVPNDASSHHHQNSRVRPSLSRHTSISSRQQLPLKSLSRLSLGQSAGAGLAAHDAAAAGGGGGGGGGRGHMFRRASWARLAVPTAAATAASALPTLPPRSFVQTALGSSLPAHLSRAAYMPHIQTPPQPSLSQHAAGGGGGGPSRNYHPSKFHVGAGVSDVNGIVIGGGGGGGGGYLPSVSNYGSSMFLTSFGSPATGALAGPHAHAAGGGGSIPPLGVLSSARGSGDWFGVNHALLGYASNNGTPTVLQSLYGSNTSRASRPLTPFGATVCDWCGGKPDLAALLGSRASVESVSAAAAAAAAAAPPGGSFLVGMPSTALVSQMVSPPRSNLQGLFLRTITAGIISESATNTTPSNSDKRSNGFVLPNDMGQEQCSHNSTDPAAAANAAATTLPAPEPAAPAPLPEATSKALAGFAAAAAAAAVGGGGGGSGEALLHAPLAAFMASNTSSDRLAVELAAVTLQGGLFGGGGILNTAAIGSAANAEGHQARIGGEPAGSRRLAGSSNGIAFFHGSSGGVGSYNLFDRQGKLPSATYNLHASPGPIAEATETPPCVPASYGVVVSTGTASASASAENYADEDETLLDILMSTAGSSAPGRHVSVKQAPRILPYTSSSSSSRYIAAAALAGSAGMATVSLPDAGVQPPAGQVGAGASPLPGLGPPPSPGTSPMQTIDFQSVASSLAPRRIDGGAADAAVSMYGDPGGCGDGRAAAGTATSHTRRGCTAAAAATATAGSESFSFVPVVQKLAGSHKAYPMAVKHCEDFSMGVGVGGGGWDGGGGLATSLAALPPQPAVPLGRPSAPRHAAATTVPRGVRKSTSFIMPAAAAAAVPPVTLPTSYVGSYSRTAAIAAAAAASGSGGGGQSLPRNFGWHTSYMVRTPAQHDTTSPRQHREPQAMDPRLPAPPAPPPVPWTLAATTATSSAEPMYGNLRHSTSERRQQLRRVGDVPPSALGLTAALGGGRAADGAAGMCAGGEAGGGAGGGGGGMGAAMDFATPAWPCDLTSSGSQRREPDVSLRAAFPHTHAHMQPYPQPQPAHHRHHNHLYQHLQAHFQAHLPAATSPHRLASSNIASGNTSPVVAPPPPSYSRSSAGNNADHDGPGAAAGGSAGGSRSRSAPDDAIAVTSTASDAATGTGAIEDSPAANEGRFMSSPRPPAVQARSLQQHCMLPSGGCSLTGLSAALAAAGWSTELGSVAGRRVGGPLGSVAGSIASRAYESVTLALPAGPGSTTAGCGSSGIAGGLGMTGWLSVAQLAGHLMLGSMKGRGGSDAGSAATEAHLQSGVGVAMVATAASTPAEAPDVTGPPAATAAAASLPPLFGGFAGTTAISAAAAAAAAANGGGSGTACGAGAPGAAAAAASAAAAAGPGGAGRQAGPPPRPPRTAAQPGVNAASAIGSGFAGMNHWRSAHGNQSAADLDGLAGSTAAWAHPRGGGFGAVPTHGPHVSYPASDMGGGISGGGTVNRGGGGGASSSHASLPLFWQEPHGGGGGGGGAASGPSPLPPPPPPVAAPAASALLSPVRNSREGFMLMLRSAMAMEITGSCANMTAKEARDLANNEDLPEGGEEEAEGVETGDVSGTRSLSTLEPVYGKGEEDSATVQPHRESATQGGIGTHPGNGTLRTFVPMSGQTTSQEHPTDSHGVSILAAVQRVSTRRLSHVRRPSIVEGRASGGLSLFRRPRLMQTHGTSGQMAWERSASVSSRRLLSASSLAEPDVQPPRSEGAEPLPSGGDNNTAPAPTAVSSTSTIVLAPAAARDTDSGPRIHGSGSIRGSEFVGVHARRRSAIDVPTSTAVPSEQEPSHHQPAPLHHDRSFAGVRQRNIASHALLVIDMGVHRLQLPALGPAYGDVYDGVQVIQLLPAHLKHRAAYHPPLKSQAQLAPGFFDAPGAAQPPSFPRLSLMFIQPAGYSAVANANLEVAERSGAVFCAAVRELLQMYGVYECQEYECTFMVACNNPRMAAEAGLALQEWLLQGLPCQGASVPRGFRAKVGIFTGVPLSVVPHATTGRADYFGAIVNRAARLMAGAKAGQVLMDKTAALEVLREWRQAAADAAAAVTAAAASTLAATAPALAAVNSVPTLAGGRTASGSSLPVARVAQQTAMEPGPVLGPSLGPVLGPSLGPVLGPAGPLSPLRTTLGTTTRPTAAAATSSIGCGNSDGECGGLAYERYLSALAAGALATTARAMVSLSVVQVVDLGIFQLKGLPEGQAVVSVQLKATSSSPAATAAAPTSASAIAAGGGGTAGRGVVEGEAAAGDGAGAGEGFTGGERTTETCGNRGGGAAAGLGKKAVLLAAGQGLLDEVLVALPAFLPLGSCAVV